MKVSSNGIRFIANFEGFASRPYKHGSDPWTIGYGETKGIGPSSGPWTIGYAQARLNARVNRDFAPAVDRWRRKHRLKWNQNQFDAMVSVAYNLGVGMFIDGSSVGNSLRHALLVQRDTNVVLVLKLYRMPGTMFEAGLLRRRVAEGRLYTQPLNKKQRARWKAELDHRRAQLRRLRPGKRRAAIRRRYFALKRALGL